MKKLGILTLNDNNNYGNRLQSYAVQEFFRENSMRAENIYAGPNVFINILKSKIKYITNRGNQRRLSKRYKFFRDFNKNISFSKYKVINGHIDGKINAAYDSFFVGSDQVWNPHWAANEIFFLPFASEKKRNSFSASIAVNELPEESKEFFSRNIKSFNKVSVREESGKSIIEDITSRNDVEVLVDPTMLLSANQWDCVSKRPKQLDYIGNKRYILNYFLGECQIEWKNEITRIAEENGCTIINILDPNDPFYYTGPSEFLYLEKNAFLICTDSFHSSVFSIIYDTPFVVFNRKDKHASMSSRIDTLVSKFGLENRKFSGSISDDLLKCDYSNAKEILENEKEKSRKFLCNALDIEE